MTSTTPTPTRQLAATVVGRPLLTLIQTMLAGSASPSTGRSGVSAQPPGSRRS